MQPFSVALPLKGKIAMPKDRQCSQFCMEQAASCLIMAELNTGPGHHQTFMRLAAQWKQIAEECSGRLHQWAQWCQKSTEE